MYEVYVAAQFEAAHRLVGDFGPATRTHGHTYRMEVIVRGEGLSEDNTLYDIGELRSAVEDLAASLHYRDLNEVPAGFTTELVLWGAASPRAALDEWGAELLQRYRTIRPGWLLSRGPEGRRTLVRASSKRPGPTCLGGDGSVLTC